MEHESQTTRIFKKIARTCAGHPVVVLSIALALTIVAGFFASNLKIEMTWLDLVPEYSPVVDAYDTIVREFQTSTAITLAIEGEDKAAMKAIAEEVKEALLTNKTIFYVVTNKETKGITTNRCLKRIDTKLDREFFRSHAFMLEKEEDLKQTKGMFKNFDLTPFLANINDEFERTRETFVEGNEMRAVRNLNSLASIVEKIGALQQVKSPAEYGTKTAQLFIDDSLYTFSADEKMLLVSIVPAFSMNDIDKVIQGVPKIRAAVDVFKEKYPENTFRMTGMHVVADDEMRTAGEDSMVLSMLAFVLILVAFVVVFRMWGAPLLAMIVLLVGVVWDLGIASVVIGRLNLMTAMTAMILMGLGIDYFIHIVSVYSEGKKEGRTSVEASVFAMEKTSGGVFLGALTTALAFYMLTTSRMPLFKELGFIIGTGIVMTMVASFTILPAALALGERVTERTIPVAGKVLLYALAVITVIPALLIAVDFVSKRVVKSDLHGESPLFQRLGKTIEKHAGRILGITSALIIALACFIPRVTFDENLMNLEMKGLESVELQREIIERFGFSDGSITFTTNSLEKTQEMYDIIDKNKSVGFIDSLAVYIPSDARQTRRLPHLRAIQEDVALYTPSERVDKVALAEEIDRFTMNLEEMLFLAESGGQTLLADRILELIAQDKEGETRFTRAMQNVRSADDASLTAFQKGFGARMKENVTAMATPERVTLATVPSRIRDLYVNDEGDAFLTSVFSKSDAWEAPTKSYFAVSLTEPQGGEPAVIPNATGMVMLIKVLIEEGAREGRFVIIISLITIFVLMLIDFRNVKAALMGVLPLLLGAVVMLGITGVTKFPHNIMGVMMLPLIIGIGVDDAIHLIHRFRLEEGDVSVTLGSTGKALFLTSLTTMFAFGSLAFGKFQGFVTIGVTLFIGIGACFVMTIFFLTPLLTILTKRLHLSLAPWGSEKKK